MGLNLIYSFRVCSFLLDGESHVADPVYVKPRFTILDPKGGYTISSDGCIAIRMSGGGHLHALLTPPVSPQTPPAYLKIKVSKMTNTCGYFLGVIGNASPASGTSFYDPTFYGFIKGASNSGGPSHLFSLETSEEFQTGDTVVFQLDTTAHTLKMVITRLGRVFTITGLKNIPYWFHVNLWYENDQVEVLDVTPSDIKLF